MALSFRYSNDRDKARGCAAMAIALMACDAEDLISTVNLDAPAGSNMVMSHDFAYPANPCMGAKILWKNNVKDLRAMTTMVVANITCRSYLADAKAPDADTLEAIRAAVHTEGADVCGLEADECDRIYNSCMATVRRVFGHRSVMDATDRFAAHLVVRRSMSLSEIIEYLSSLGLR